MIVGTDAGASTAKDSAHPFQNLPKAGESRLHSERDNVRLASRQEAQIRLTR